MASEPATASAIRSGRTAWTEPWVRYRWNPAVTPAAVTTYPTTASTASNGDSPQPQATGTAASRATNGVTTKTHSIVTAAVDWVASIMGFGPGRAWFTTGLWVGALIC